MRRLEGVQAVRGPVTEVYAGQHWAAAKAAGGLAESAWVASAGYGLIPFDAPVVSYSATFALGDPDSVVPSRAKAKPTAPADWWDTLAAWPGPVTGFPRRVAELADPDGFLLVVAGVAYLRAMGRDLLAAAERAPGKVAVVCGGAGAHHPLSELLLPCNARLQAVVGGSLAALNARVALHLLRHPPAEWTFAAARGRLAEWLAVAPPLVRPIRRGLDDEEVVGFIRRQMRTTPAVSATALLRILRGRGMACEASRFARLYRTAAEG